MYRFPSCCWLSAPLLTRRRSNVRMVVSVHCFFSFKTSAMSVAATGDRFHVSVMTSHSASVMRIDFLILCYRCNRFLCYKRSRCQDFSVFRHLGCVAPRNPKSSHASEPKLDAPCQPQRAAEILTADGRGFCTNRD